MLDVSSSNYSCMSMLNLILCFLLELYDHDSCIFQAMRDVLDHEKDVVQIPVWATVHRVALHNIALEQGNFVVRNPIWWLGFHQGNRLTYGDFYWRVFWDALDVAYSLRRGEYQPFICAC